MTQRRAPYITDVTMDQLAQAPVAEPERPRIDRSKWQRFIDELLDDLRNGGSTTALCPYCHKTECSH